MSETPEACRLRQRGISAAARVRLEASKQRPRRPIPDTCPRCQAPTARDGSFAYCAKRCGWFATPGGGRPVVAAEPAVSIRTPDPDPTEEEDDMTHDDTETAPDHDDADDLADDAPTPPPARKARKAPPPKPVRRAYGEGKALVLAAIRAGKDGYRVLRDATGLGDSSLYGALQSLEEAGLIRVINEGKQRRYLPAETQAKPAAKKPAAKPRAKVRKPAAEPVPAPVAESAAVAKPAPRSPFAADALRVLASLTPAALDEVLDRLAPVVAARADYLARVRALAV